MVDPRLRLDTECGTVLAYDALVLALFLHHFQPDHVELNGQKLERPAEWHAMPALRMIREIVDRGDGR